MIGVGAGAFFALARPLAVAPTAAPSFPAATASGPQRTLPPPATGTPGPSSFATRTSGSAGSSPPIAIDGSLLAVLPASIRGAPLVENADGEAHDLTDPALGGEASALAAALVIDTATGDFAYVSVVRLRSGVFSDGYFRSWRETFDGGACSQAGGVAQSSAETTISGHLTFIGHCVGGILTYHVHLVDPLAGDLVVSISSLGDQRFGQLVVEGLR